MYFLIKAQIKCNSPLLQTKPPATMNTFRIKAPHHIRFLPAIVAASALTLTSCGTESISEVKPENTHHTNSDKTLTPNGVKALAGNYIIQLKNKDVSQKELQNTALDILQKAGNSNKQISFGIQSFSAELSASEAEKIKNDPRVAIIEQDQLLTMHSASENSNPSTLSEVQTTSWGVSRIGFADATASNRTAWIIDSGIQLDHPDLNVDVGRSKSFLKTSTSPNDVFGHGTQVAGILAAKDNDLGVIGVAAGAQVVSLRVMDEKGIGSVSAVISALKHVSEHGKPGDVVNLSLGSSPSVTLDNAAIEVAKKGIFVVIAAGNIADNAANYSPARVNHPNIFTVSAMRPDNTFYMGISNWGTPVDYCAPGSGLTSTRMNSSYGNAAGTSMAAPHVAGILLLKGRDFQTQGVVDNDPDNEPDPIPKL